MADDADPEEADEDRWLESGSGPIELVRPDAGPRAPVRAWDAADELLLDHLLRTGRPGTGSVTVVVNDAWGALATALATGGDPFTWSSDSYVAHRAMEANLARNGCDRRLVRTTTPLDEPPDRIDTVLLKVPKALALLEHQLGGLGPHLHDGSHVVGAGMTRHVHRSTLVAFEHTIGPTHTSLAHRKARLVHADVDPPARPAPTAWPRTDHLDEIDLDVVSHAGVFSAGRLDPGARLLLAHLPAPGTVGSVVDLGCGTGIVGTLLARADPDVHVTFVDESRLAVASAVATVTGALGPADAARRTRAAWGDGLDDLAEGPPLGDGTVDLVVVNPPFHRDHSVGDATAWLMFRQARRVLRPGGELLVVGNRHLGYHAKLRRLFGGCEVAGSDPRFVVLRARR